MNQQWIRCTGPGLSWPGATRAIQIDGEMRGRLTGTQLLAYVAESHPITDFNLVEVSDREDGRSDFTNVCSADDGRFRTSMEQCPHHPHTIISMIDKTAAEYKEKCVIFRCAVARK